MNLNFPDSTYVGIIGELWLKVEENGEKEFFFGVDHLLVEAKTLDF